MDILSIFHYIVSNPYIVLIVLVAFVFDFTNGMHDSANSIATLVSTRVLSPKYAVIWATFFNFFAIFVVGTAVAKTVWSGMIDVKIVTPTVIFCALLWAIAWNILTRYFGLPTSSSHSLLWGFLWSAIAKAWLPAVILSWWSKTIAFIFLAPIIGMILWYFFIILSTWALRNTKLQKANKISRGLQLVSSALYSIWHGANDAQKTMGIIVSLLLSVHLTTSAEPPLWVIIWGYSAIGLGTMSWGWKIVKTMGSKLVKLRPIDWFSASLASAITLFWASYMWVPVSTTQSITGSISWVGMAKNMRSVRWEVAGNIFLAWIFTIPWACLVGAMMYYILHFFLGA